MQKSGLDHYYTRQSPDDVRFTKSTIDLNFAGQHEFENIYDVLRALEQKVLQPRALPSLRVFLHDNYLWTIDNKLLYIYRISPKVRRVSVTFISGNKIMERFMQDNSKSDMNRMASADFFPEVVRANALALVNSSSSQNCVLLPSVPGYKKTERERVAKGQSPKSSSSRSTSSTKTVASRISSDENADWNLATATEVASPYSKSLRHKHRHNMRASAASTVKPHNVKNHRNGQKKGRKLSPDNSMGYILSKDLTSEINSAAPTPEPKLRGFCCTPVEKECDFQTSCPPRPSPNITPFFARPVVECRDIPVSSTLPPVETMTEPRTNWGTSHHAADLLNLHPQAESPATTGSDMADELSKWRDDNMMDVEPDLVGNVGGKYVAKVEAPSNCRTGSEMEGEGQFQQVLENVPSTSPSRKQSEMVSNNSSDSSKGRHSRLDRPLSSCGSSAPPFVERPSTSNFPLDGSRRNNSLFRLCTTTGTHHDRTNQSPPKVRVKAFMSTEKKTQSKLSHEHELEVSKKILLKHMKKTFFSVY